MFVVYGANDLVANASKIICVKTFGELVKKWRIESGLSVPDLARRIGGGVKYQNIQQLEGGDAKHPRYIAALAKAMGSTVDDLLALRMPTPLGLPGTAPPPPLPPVDYKDRREVSESDWATLQAVKMLVPEDRLDEMRRRYAEAEARIREQLAATAQRAATVNTEALAKKGKKTT